MTKPIDPDELFKLTLDYFDRQIGELESYFAVTTIDAWPFVVVNDLTGTAVKRVDKDAFNFAAEGRDAVQYSRARADEVVQLLAKDGHVCHVEGKYQFFARKLEQHRATRAYMAENYKPARQEA